MGYKCNFNGIYVQKKNIQTLKHKNKQYTNRDKIYI